MANICPQAISPTMRLLVLTGEATAPATHHCSKSSRSSRSAAASAASACSLASMSLTSAEMEVMKSSYSSAAVFFLAGASPLALASASVFSKNPAVRPQVQRQARWCEVSHCLEICDPGRRSKQMSHVTQPSVCNRQWTHEVTCAQTLQSNMNHLWEGQMSELAALQRWPVTPFADGLQGLHCFGLAEPQLVAPLPDPYMPDRMEAGHCIELLCKACTPVCLHLT